MRNLRYDLTFGSPKKNIMPNTKSLIDELNRMLLEGKTLEAFDKFYADNVVMQENETSPTIGKHENRKREEKFLNDLIDFRGAKLHEVAYGDNLTMTKWSYDYTHKDWGVRNYTQVSVQHWKDDKIVKEQFFYGN